MLEARNLTKVYGRHTALDSLNLHVGAGEIYGLLGGNGAGKTTTLSLFLNFISPTSGQALVNGRDVTEHSAASKQDLAYLPEIVNLYRHLSGIENLKFFAALAGQSRLSQNELQGLLDRAGLPRFAVHRRVGTYSKGMRQKVAIAIALAKNAKALLLDEPTSGLDPHASDEFSKLLESLRDHGMAILMATHDLLRAKAVSTRIGIMQSGRLVQAMETSETSLADLEAIYLELSRNAECAV